MENEQRTQKTVQFCDTNGQGITWHLDEEPTEAETALILDTIKRFMKNDYPTTLKSFLEKQ